VCNLDAIIIQKLRRFGSPKIIIIIATSLTSNNFIDAPNGPKNITNQYKNGVNGVLQGTSR
jgi:hypothetical protein